ncbi:MAG: DUF4296 domain-containing protein [Chitinophaga sp.]|uniref:DUF4296 domain-containing protein n=1 Tax=Chitinophaga sp. TaxID=1869181 RepID=UPI0025C205BD|nr:DUF4296 domain-containing protein [Chitinophaga sp.]MBV8255738.1 DUF4296 domain-containing protein [Chitinophaga sp.]
MNYFKKLSAAACMIFLFACGDAERTPKGIMPPDKMSAVLRDLTIAEAYGNNVSSDQPILFDSLRQEKIKVYSKQVLDLNHVTVKEFTTSYAWYEAHPDRLREVLNTVQADIMARKNKAPDMGEMSAPAAYRLRTIFPYAERAILLKANSDTIRPFIKRQKI